MATPKAVKPPIAGASKAVSKAVVVGKAKPPATPTPASKPVSGRPSEPPALKRAQSGAGTGGTPSTPSGKKARFTGAQTLRVVPGKATQPRQGTYRHASFSAMQESKTVADYLAKAAKGFAGDSSIARAMTDLHYRVAQGDVVVA